jgi:hypothetical protein
MSAYGSKCLRKPWFKQHKPEIEEPLQGEARLKFIYGDIIEELVLGLAEASGHKVEGRQTRMNYAGLEGSRDAVIDGVTVDVKSANSRGFRKFKDHRLQFEDPFGYLSQISLYTLAAKDDPSVVVKDKSAFLAVDKERGQMVLDVYDVQHIEEAEVIGKIDAVYDKETLPPRGYKPVPEGFSGNEVLCVECSYCPFKEECWKDANKGQGLLKYLYANGVKFFTKVAKEPRVQQQKEFF